ncbi:NADPH HC-toxin reductase 1-like [Malus domestica]|uniref:NADPH HC-toxin reductase 1-like n=1 Tax=Malus domestica TaxID=3750 RepID=UPI003974A6D5
MVTPYVTDDASKVGLLKSLPNANTKFFMFQADLYMTLKSLSLPLKAYKDTGEAAVAGVRIIADSCICSQTVKQLIYTASILAASPWTEDGAGLKPYFD